MPDPLTPHRDDRAEMTSPEEGVAWAFRTVAEILKDADPEEIERIAERLLDRAEELESWF